MNHKRAHHPISRRSGHGARGTGRLKVGNRHGVILLIVLGLLSLFMLIAISFVLEAGHERRGAKAAAYIDQQGDPPDALVKMAMYQIIRGPRSPNSVIGPHSLLEDMYGEYDGIVGAVARDGSSGVQLLPRLVYYDNFIEITAISFGPDRKPGIAGIEDSQPPNNIIDDVGEAPVTGNGPVKGDDYRFGQQFVNGQIVDNVEGYYAGRVITMLTGTCAKLSTRIVRYFQTNYNSSTGQGSWVLWLKPFDTVPLVAGQAEIPSIGDTFVINGRPFNGGGFGYDPNAYNMNNAARYGQPDLGLSWATLFGSSTATDVDSLAPFALTPNPTHPKFRDYLNDRPYINASIGSGPPVQPPAMIANPQPVPITVDADEDYDAPDFQNMMLAQRSWIPASPNSGAVAGTGSWQVRIPSLHRPELVDYWMRANGLNPATTSWTALPAGERNGANYAPRLRQRIVLRPDPNDHVYQDLNHNGRYDAGEPNWSGNTLFNPINGPWDVDNDNDGAPDSVWVDLGAPVQTAPDGTQFKPLFAILCLDMDGRLNLNAHGNSTHYEFANATSSASSPAYPYNHPQYTPAVHPGSLKARTDEANVLGMTRYFSNQSNPANMVWPVPVPINGPYAASSPSNPAVGGSQDYMYTQQPNSYEYTYPSNPSGSGSVVTSWNKQVGVGLGFSVAEINLCPVLGIIPSIENGYPGTYVRSNHLRWLLEGRYEGYYYPQSTNDQRPPIPGRYGEAHLDTSPSYSFAANRLPWPRPKAGITAGQTVAIGVGIPNASGDDNTPAAVVGSTTPAASVVGIQPPLLPGYSPLKTYNAGLPTGNFYQDSMVSNVPINTATPGLVNPGVLIPGYSSPLMKNYIRQGLNGSPNDPNGRLMPGLDLRGQPLYGNMPSIVYPNSQLVDDPWELDLSDKAARFGLLFNQTGGVVAKFEIDKPLTPADLETILRFADIDNWALAQRAEHLFEMNLNDPGGGSINLRNRVTTESWDIPCPNVLAPPEILTVLQSYGLPTNNLTFSDLVRGKILAANKAVGSNITVTQATTYAQSLLGCNLALTQSARGTDRAIYRAISPDLLLGLRMDINRPFGNGIDDNGNGTIDEPLETLQAYNLTLTQPVPPLPFPATRLPTSTLVTASTPAEPLWKFPAAGSTLSHGVGMDTNWDGHLTFTDALARQEFAKHLYTLMMLVTDINYTLHYPTTESYFGSNGTFTTVPISPSAAAPSPREILHAHRVAQWAVNVVDFRDRDAIMTWFEYDIRPFFADAAAGGVAGVSVPSGVTWEVDGLLSHGTSALSRDDVQPYRGLVWGMEYPDLLITETVAFHDKAVANSSVDTTSRTKHAVGQIPPSRTKPDTTWDQIRVPQGSLFVELYCTGRPNLPGWPTLANTPPTGVGNTSYAPQNYPPPNLPYYPPELYDVTNPIAFPPPMASPSGMQYRQGALVLSKTDPNGVFPVWRLATTTPGAGTTNANNVQRLFQTHPETAILQPQVLGTGVTAGVPGMTLDTNIWNNYLQKFPPGGAGTATVRQSLTLDRVAYFTTTNAKFTTGTATGASTTQTGIDDFYYRPPTTVAAGLPSKIVPNSTTPYYPYNYPNNLFLQPGCYAVVGPYRGPLSEAPVKSGAHNSTYIGYVNSSKSFGGRTHAQFINLQSQSLSSTTADMVFPLINQATTSYTAANHYPSTAAGTGAKIKYPLGIPVASGLTLTATKQAGLNISEPNGGYGAQSYYTAPSVTTTYGTGSTAVSVTDSFSTYADTPWDMSNIRLGSPGPNNKKPGTNDGTTLDCCTVLLQRLADPTMPYDPYTNPYITVDWMNIDLTVFNGQSSYSDGGIQTVVQGFDVPMSATAGTGTNPGTPAAQTNATLPFNFQTRQRGPRVPPNALSPVTPAAPSTLASGTVWPQNAGGSSTYAYGWPASVHNRPSSLAGPQGQTNYGAFNGFNEAPLWSSFSDDPQPTMAVGQSKTVSGPKPLANTQPPFNHYLHSTLGFVNDGYGIVSTTGNSPGVIDGAFVSGAATRYHQITTTAPYNVLYEYVGDPIRPFPWLTWNNRPFANPMELLLVPASSPERFGYEFSYKTHYTDPIIAPLLYQSHPQFAQYRLYDNHYAPMRNPFWDYFNATQLWGNGTPGGAGAATASLQAVVPIATNSAPSAPTNVASSQTMFPPLQFDPTIDYSHGLPYQLLSSTTAPPFDPPNTPFTPLAGYTTTGTAITPGPLRGGYPFGHLLNFFASGSPSTPQVNPIKNKDALALIPAPNYFRLLEFVTVPSPFSGTEDPIFPVNLSGVTAGQPLTTNVIQATVSSAGTTWPPSTSTRWPLNNQYSTNSDLAGYFPFQAPFNRISRFREPGRVNINTISDRDVFLNTSAANPSGTISYNPAIWRGITNDFPNYQQQWFDLRASMSAVDPRGPDRQFNTPDDHWHPGGKFGLNLYGIGQPASANTGMQSALGFVSSIEQSFGQSGFNAAMPTIYTNPFRSYMNPLRAPMVGMWNRYKISAANQSAAAAPLLFVDATLLRRSDPDVLMGCEPVFTQNAYAWNVGLNPSASLGISATSTPLPTTTASLLGAPPYPQAKLNNEFASSFNDPNRNPFFRYYPLQKIGASVTTRSNVYGVWVTVGYFEVQKIPLSGLLRPPVQVPFSNPDGYQLVRELNSDIGAAKRNRGFFILDRSIPVGFMRGENLNVDKAILLRRMIQ